MPAPRRATKHDVELAKVETRAGRDLAIVRWLGIALALLASALPIWMLTDLVEPLAGKTTVVDVNLVVSIALSVSVVVNIAQYAKSRSRKRELQRGRDRQTRFELQRGEVTADDDD